MGKAGSMVTQRPEPIVQRSDDGVTVPSSGSLWYLDTLPQCIKGLVKRPRQVSEDRIEYSSVMQLVQESVIRGLHSMAKSRRTSAFDHVGRLSG